MKSQFLLFTLGLLVVSSSARDVNDKVISIIKEFDIWHQCYYLDSVQIPRIGYGHKVEPEEGYKEGSCLTPEEGEQLFKKDLSGREKCIEAAVKVPLTDDQFGALVSWAYDVGCVAAHYSELVKLLNEGKKDRVCQQLKRWNRSNGTTLPELIRRRDQECKLFSSAQKVNDKAIEIIKEFNSWQKCYTLNSNGIHTIGYGHKIQQEDGYKEGLCLTPEEGEILFRKDLAATEKCIENMVKVTLTENEFGALASWVYDVGCVSAHYSELVKVLNKGQKDNVCPQLKKWNMSNGKILPELIRRREHECNLFTSL